MPYNRKEASHTAFVLRIVNKAKAKYLENIGAHHGSLSKEHRINIENIEA